MLTEISVKNIAVLEDVKIGFREGLNVITGETGAGKSILIESLKLAFGEKISQSLIPDVDEGVIEIVYELGGDDETVSSLESAGLSSSEFLIMRRKVSPHGRSRIYLNDSPVTSQLVAEITSELVSILGQHGYQKLFGSKHSTRLLDGFCGNFTLYGDYVKAHRKWRKIIREIDLFKEDAPHISERVEWLDSCIGELTGLELKQDEDREIEEEMPVLKNAAKIKEAVRDTIDFLDQNEVSSISLLKHSIDRLNSVSQFDPSLADAARRLEEFLFSMTDISRDLFSRFSEIDIDEERYQELVERLSLIKRIARKYGTQPEGLIGKIHELMGESEKLQESIEKLNNLELEEKKIRQEMLSLARSLGDKRRGAASQFETSVMNELAELGLSEAIFTIVFTGFDPEEPSTYGLERADFLFSPSPSFEGGPLTQIASGGELSRILLAVHNTVSGREKFRTLIFDEVDAGIGGSMAESVGEKLKKLSSSAQVICITHLPQIAALADHHIKIVKVREGKREKAVAKALDRRERVEEIARMVSGEKISVEAKRYAENLLKNG